MPTPDQPNPDADKPDSSSHQTAETVAPPETANPLQSKATETFSLETASSCDLAGRYKLLSTIGEGGMGSVWLAEQRVPVKRLVAVKLIKAGMDSKAVLARFDAERQALAMMDHPNIAKILDGGITETGSPYFVMELVKGIPITQYCDTKKLNLKERLELFIPVCQAIQHAHQKGIIHRDIKPSNVLVANYDDTPVPKIIDFGVAKATGQALTDQTLNTGFGVVGTPQYMSPEQATLNQLDIDTRSDIYSLGVLLYELLTGSPPFGTEELKKAGYLEILRVIREEEPKRPSTKLSTADQLPSIASSRSTEPKKLTGMLRSELDWVVMKALEKDRVRRYETANAFAADVERYLNGAPVEAHPPSRVYQLKKFILRYRAPVIAASLVCLAMTIAIVGTTIGLFEANRQKTIAQQQKIKAQESEREAIVQKTNAERAEEEALEAYRSATDEAISDLMSSKEYLGPQEKLYLQKALNRWNNFANRQGDDERSLAFRAEGMYRVGKLFTILSGSSDEKLSQAEQYARQLCERVPNSDRYEKLLANILQEQRQGGESLEAELSRLQLAQRLFEKILARNPDSPSAKFDLGKAQMLVAGSQMWHGDYENAIKNLSKSTDLFRKLEAEAPDNKHYLFELSAVYATESQLFYQLRRYDESVAKALEALTLSKRLVQMEPDSRKFLAGLAGDYRAVGIATSFQASENRSLNAEEYLKSAIQIARDLCTKYPNDADSLNQLSEFLNDYSNNSWKTDSQQAVELASEAVAIQERLCARFPGTGIGGLATRRLNLLHKFYVAKRYQECVDLAVVHSEFLKERVKHFDDDFHYQQCLVSVLKFRGNSQEALNLTSDAEQSYREAFQASTDLANMTTEFNAVAEDVSSSSAGFLRVLKKQKKMGEVCELYERLIAFQDEKNDRPRVFLTMQEYANYLADSGNAEGGLKWSNQAIDEIRNFTKSQNSTANFQRSILACRLIRAKALCLLKRTEEAQAEWNQLLEVSDEKGKNAIRTERVLARFDAGLVSEALQEINDLVRTATLPSSTWYTFSLRYAQAASESSDKLDLYRKRSIAILQKAADSGFATTTDLKKLTAFESLRDLPGFQKATDHIESNASYAIANQKVTRGDYAGSIADYDRALTLNPSKSGVLNSRGWAKHNVGDDRGALSDYEQEIANLPDSEVAYSNTAFLLATTKDESLRNGASALEIADKGLQIKSSGYGFNAKSCALAALGRFEEAIQCQKTAMEDPTWMKDKGIDGGEFASARIEAWQTNKLWHPPIQNLQTPPSESAKSDAGP